MFTIPFLGGRKKREEGRLGLDIGSHSVKVIEITGPDDKPELTALSYEKIHSADSRTAIVDAVTQCVARAHLSSKDVNTAITGPGVIVRFIEIPQMKDSELKNAIPFEAEKYIPFSVKEVTLGYYVLLNPIGKGKMLILLVAAKKDLVEERMKTVKDAGLTADIVDVSSIAVANAFLAQKRLSKDKKNKVCAIIDIGAKGTDIDIIDDDVLYFTRSIQMGGDNIAKVAEEKVPGFKGDIEELVYSGSYDKGEFSAAVESVMCDIIDEIRPSFGYFENQSGKMIDEVFITGGASKLAEIGEILRKHLELKVVKWNPLEGVEINKSIDKDLLARIRDQLGVSVGLAIRRN